MTLRAALASLALLLTAAAPAFAQFHPGSPDDPDTPIDAATRSAVIESLAVAVQHYYVFPDRGAQLAKNLRERRAHHEYDRITSSKEFADSLRAHMQASTHDLHMRVHYRYEPLPQNDTTSGPNAQEIAAELSDQRLRNFGFERVQRMSGNIGYLDLRQFSGLPEAQATAVAAMTFLGNCDAVIVDLRRNGGGAPEMIQTLLSYFVAPGDRLHINDFYERDGDRTVQWWSTASVPGPRLAGRPIYVLTSGRTGSAAEEFAYDVQTHKLGTTWGETSAGGANPGGLVRIGDHFAAFIATGRAINPVTHTNWEGTGVHPDHAVPAPDALREAYTFALQQRLETEKDPQMRNALTAAIERAKLLPADPPEDFKRPQQRRVAG